MTEETQKKRNVAEGGGGADAGINGKFFRKS